MEKKVVKEKTNEKVRNKEGNTEKQKTKGNNEIISPLACFQCRFPSAPRRDLV